MINSSLKQFFLIDSDDSFNIIHEKSSLFSKLFIMLMSVFFLLNLALFSLQLFFPNTYDSDFPAHINFALEGYSYSLISFLILLVSFLPNEIFLFAVAFMLALFNTFSAILLRGFAYKILGINNINKLLDFSIFALFFVTMIFSPFDDKSYILASSPNVWHNSTIILNRFFAILCIDSVLNCIVKYKEFRLKRINYKNLTVEYIKLSIFTALCMWAKPSFLSAFMPACVIIFLLALIITKGESFFASLFIGISFLPAMIVILFQNYILFSESKNDFETGVSIAPLALQLTWNESLFDYAFRLLLATAFPVFVCVMSIKKQRFIEHLIYLSTAIGWLIAVLLIENGPRMSDGNFFWGFTITLFFAYFIAVFRVIKGDLGKIVNRISCGLFLLHFVCGLYYYFKILLGESIL